MFVLSHALRELPMYFLPQAMYEGVSIVGLCGVPSLLPSFAHQVISSCSHPLACPASSSGSPRGAAACRPARASRCTARTGTTDTSASAAAARSEGLCALEKISKDLARRSLISRETHGRGLTECPREGSGA